MLFLHFGAGTETMSQLCHLGGNFYLVLAQSSHHLLIKSFKRGGERQQKTGRFITQDLS